MFLSQLRFLRRRGNAELTFVSLVPAVFIRQHSAFLVCMGSRRQLTFHVGLDHDGKLALERVLMNEKCSLESTIPIPVDQNGQLTGLALSRWR